MAIMSGMQSKQGAKVFQGFKDLSTKILEKLKGRSEVSKQFISDLTNSGDLKQVERDLIRNTLDSMKSDKIPVQEFADKVKSELLPLDWRIPKGVERYESIALPDNLKGNVANYLERIWESPIKTSAGSVHFGKDTPNYFGHTRIEDMANPKDMIGFEGANLKTLDPSIVKEMSKSGTIRRVIEVQSDLYQKGGLERELEIGPIPGKMTAQERVSKLQQYNDPTAHFRMVREELKQAAIDGKTKVQFPTGETAMKIEGLQTENRWEYKDPSGRYGFSQLTPEKLSIGKEVLTNTGRDAWIITDVLGDGKFKAVPKEHFDSVKNRFTKGTADFQTIADELDLYKIESFDISGKIDTNDPIYKFYEKDIGSYLKNKYNATLVTDDKGVSWWEVPITKEQGNLPVEAFSIAGLGLGSTVFKKREESRK